MNNLPSCPSCDVKLKKIPKRTSKCKACGIKVYVRRETTVYPSIYLNEDQAETYDALKLLSHQGISLKKFIQERKKLTAEFESRGFSKPLDFDVIWRIYHNLAEKYAKIPDFDKLSNIYFYMAAHLRKHGHDDYAILKHAQEYRLRDIRILFKKNVIVEIESLQTSCEPCRNSDSHKMRLSQAMEEMPLPHKDCVCDLGCSCIYYAASEW